jgi:hypothetical protein
MHINRRGKGVGKIIKGERDKEREGKEKEWSRNAQIQVP